MYFSIDVECVATGTDHNSRAVAQISLVVRDSVHVTRTSLCRTASCNKVASLHFAGPI